MDLDVAEVVRQIVPELHPKQPSPEQTKRNAEDV
jgi:hypothetical protein